MIALSFGKLQSTTGSRINHRKRNRPEIPVQSLREPNIGRQAVRLRSSHIAAAKHYAAG
jgi:hypothetical protein